LPENLLDIEVKDTVFDPDLPRTSAKVHFREKGARTYYKVWLYVEGNDLPYIESVTYTLHETFRNPDRTVRRTPSNPNCQLVIWTWGLFTMKATIVDKKGFRYEVAHELGYDKDLPSENERYEREEEDPSSNARPRLVSA